MPFLHHFLLSTAFVPALLAVTGPPPVSPGQWQQLLDSVPVSFEPNTGQFHRQVDFRARATGYTLFLAGEEAVAATPNDVMRMRLRGARPEAKWQGLGEAKWYSNYFLGNQPSEWRSKVVHSAGVTQREVYPGIDWEFHGEGRRAEYRFHIAPGADPAQIAMALEAGAAPRIEPDGSLVLRTPSGVFRHSRPHAFQTRSGHRTRVAAAFTVSANGEVGFEIGAYDPARELIIDPVVSYSSFMGGVAPDYPIGVATDREGHIFVAGSTISLDFPIAGSPFRDFNTGRNDVFVMRIAASFQAWGWSTYFGGTLDDLAAGVAVRSNGHVVVTGSTTSTNFPVNRGSFQETPGGGLDGFVAAVVADGGALSLASYLGGGGDDRATALVVDSLDNVYVTGTTSSANFPLRLATQSTLAGESDLFLARIHSNNDLAFSTLYGAAGPEEGHAITLDKAGDIYIAGRAFCGPLPLGGRIGPLSGWDVLVMKWRAADLGVAYVTCIGGAGVDAGYGIAADAAGSAYVTGATGSPDFPMLSPLQGRYGGADGISGFGDAFLLKLNPSGTILQYSTYLGGGLDDLGQSIVLDRSGGVYLAGVTGSPNFPAANGSKPPAVGVFSGFVLRFTPQLSLWNSVFFEPVDRGDRYAVALDAQGRVLVSGGARSGFKIPKPATSPLIAYKGIAGEAFVARLHGTNLQLQQDTYPLSVTPGTAFTLVQRAVNRGPIDAENVSITGSVSQGMRLAGCVSQAGLCSASESGFRVDVATLPIGRSLDVSLTVQISDQLPPGASANVASRASSETMELDLGDNTLVTTVFTIQSSGTCEYSLGGQSAVISPQAVFVTFPLTTPFFCGWTTFTGTNWLSISSAASATGTGAARVDAAANSGSSARLGSIYAGGLRALILQQGTAPPEVFSDVAATNPFAPYIQLVRQNNVTTGCEQGRYCPDNPTSRGEMAVFIIRALFGTDSFPYPTNPYFADVPANHPFFPHIQKMRELGITSGCSATLFCVNDAVTRAQMAAFLVRARLGIAAGQGFGFPSKPLFEDVPGSHPFFNAIQKMKELGITSGCGATAYCPDSTTTRGQMAVFLSRAFFAP